MAVQLTSAAGCQTHRLLLLHSMMMMGMSRAILTMIVIVTMLRIMTAMAMIAMMMISLLVTAIDIATAVKTMVTVTMAMLIAATNVMMPVLVLMVKIALIVIVGCLGLDFTLNVWSLLMVSACNDYDCVVMIRLLDWKNQ